VAKVVVSRRAADDLAFLIRTYSLPRGTQDRVRKSIEPLAEFPMLGAQLAGRWEGLRVILGPWRWMLIVYQDDEATTQVIVLTILDGRSSRAPRAM
jgi:plasmid stabilization system protein ParE